MAKRFATISQRHNMSSSDMRNPFAVQTPEDISADDVVSLFVDVFADFQNILKQGHTFLHGPRGSGKSMMFRFLEPDCQQLFKQRTLDGLDFFAVYVPIKNTELKLTELKRLENMHANLVLNEHFLVQYVAIRFFASLIKANVPDSSGIHAEAVAKLYDSELKRLLIRAGWSDQVPNLASGAKLSQHFADLQSIFADQYASVLMYVRRLAFESGPVPYTGPLTGYLDFLFPLMKKIKELQFMPRAPIFLLMDDADNLSKAQTSILNSWVSCRTSADVSLKISTQLNYETFLTSSGRTIDSPHDFSEVNISSVYTTRKKSYHNRVAEIVKKRLTMYGIECSPDEFFPPAAEQEQRIRSIAMDIKANWNLEGRGFRASDDILRYARPDYMKGLLGTSKSGPTYKYAGFDQLVHISSGIIRYFLESASLMYGEMRSLTASHEVTSISPEVQDRIVRQQAEEFLFSEFDRWSTDEAKRDESTSTRVADKTRRLRNLIRALGGTFHEILLSDASERRVFSVALTDEPSSDVLEVFDLGVQYGYFHQSSIGNKEGTGRTRLYILSRRLAPSFGLDPTSFAGYKFVTNEALREAAQKPKTFLGKVRRSGVDAVLVTGQLTLFEED